MYEVYSPIQALGFVIYLHLFLLAFFQWSRADWNTAVNKHQLDLRRTAPLQAENEILVISLWLFAAFALTLFRNREQVRRRILELGTRATGWWAALWPAPYVFVGCPCGWTCNHFPDRPQVASGCRMEFRHGFL